MRLTTLHTWLLLFAGLLLSSSVLAQADLSLSISQSTATPSQYSLYSVTATVSNAGPSSATGVQVSIPQPNGVVYEGGNEFAASQGSLSRFGASAGTWAVGTVAAGSSATITINYFLNGTASASYAEVSASNQSDPDSTPGNGNGTVNEDDEASTSGGSGGQADLQILNLIVQNPMLSSGTNLEYVFDILNAGSADVPGDFTVKSYLSVDNQLSPDDIQDGLITTGNFDAGAQVSGIVGASNTSALSPDNYFLIVVVDADNTVSESNENNNSTVQAFEIMGTFPTCAIAATNPSGTCNNNYTPTDASDDRIDVLITVDNINPGQPFTIRRGNTSVATGFFGTVLLFDGGLISAAGGSTITYSVTDDNDPTCTTNFTIQVPSTCSGSIRGGDIDLSLTLSQNITTPAQWTLYTVTATVSNAGPQTATGVIVDLPRPAGAVYEGGNEFSSTQGGLALYGGNAGQWNVGSLGAQQTASITISYFRTGTTPSDSYGEVLAADQTDGDSTPGNGNGQVNEDDEASTGNPVAPTCAFNATLISVDCSDNGTPTDPSDDTYSILISASNPLSIAGSWQSSNYPVGAPYGQPIREEIGRISAYPNGQIIMVDVANNACRDTLTFTAPAPCSNVINNGACTFETAASIDPLDNFSNIDGVETANGYELTASNFAPFNSASSRTAVYSFNANGVQTSPTPAVTNVIATRQVDVDFSVPELIVEDIAGNFISRVPFNNPIQASNPGVYEGGFAGRLPDGSGFLVFVRQVENNAGAPDRTTLYSFRIDNNFQQVGGVTTYPTMPTRYEGASFLAPSGQGNNYFFKLFERGTNQTFVLADGNFARLGSVSLGVNGRFFQPFEFQELPDGTFVFVSYFDGADPNRALQINRYDRNGTSLGSYASSSNVIISRDPFQAAVRPDGGFVGISQRNATGSTIEVRNGNGSLLAESYLDELYNIDLVGVTAIDTSILLLANRGTVTGPRVFVKLTRLGEQVCNPVYDPCDPPAAVDRNAIISTTVAANGIITVNHNMFGTPGSITIDGPARLGIQLITPNTFSASAVNVRGRIFITGLLRDNINPGDQQAFVLETDVLERDLNATLLPLQGTDITSLAVIGSEDFYTIYLEYYTSGRSYGIAKVQSGNIRADQLLVGDLVTNRIGGAIVNAEDDVIYLAYRNGNSGSWPRMRVLSTSDLSLISEITLASIVLPNALGLVTGNSGFPALLPSGDVAVAFDVTDSNITGQWAAVLDPMGNVVSTTSLPTFTSIGISTYSAIGQTPVGDVLFSDGGNQVALLANGNVTSCSGGPTQGVDLELTASSGSNSPAIYDVNSITITLTNAGTTMATGVSVDLPMPAGVVYTGGNEFTATQGAFATFGPDQGVWTVGDLAAGATATFVVNYFSLSATGYSQFVEVLSQNETDADSSPGNGSGVSASEDDEAFLDLTSNAPLALTLNFFPNPAPTGEQIVLNYESTGEVNLPLLVSDLNGRTIFQTQVQFAEGYNEVPVSIGQLPAGVYIVTLSDTGLQPTRLVVR